MIRGDSFLLGFVALLAVGVFPGRTEEPRLNYVVSLRNNDVNICGGALISEVDVLTAAHCVDGLDHRGLTILTGAMDIRNHVGQIHKVKNITIHPDFFEGNRTHGRYNDIALITLKTPAERNCKQETIPLPMIDITDSPLAFTAGWGETNESVPVSPRKPSTKLLTAYRVTVAIKDGCGDDAPRSILDTQHCSISREPPVPCHGDIGGPLVHDNKIIGILSIPSCETWARDVYTRVFAYKDFICRAMESFDKKCRGIVPEPAVQHCR